MGLILSRLGWGEVKAGETGEAGEVGVWEGEGVVWAEAGRIK